MNKPCDFGLKGLVHVSGAPATGKTLFAIAYASEVAMDSDVLWINTNGKMAFIEPLKQTISRTNGRPESVRVLSAMGHKMTVEIIEDIPTFLTEDTTLIVIDSITRVLDMGLRKDPMWGRVLFEEVLPSLTAMSMKHDLTILCISECREVGGSKRAVYEEAMNRFADYEIKIARTIKSGISIAEVESTPLIEIRLEDEGSVALALGGGTQ
ncbi:MAG: hypothetical protein R6V83_08410 [Candidatus Thorarchaeota archaeon]